MKKMRIYLFLSFVIISLQTAISQPQKDFVQRRGFEIQQERIATESLAVRLKLPLRIEYPDGNVSEIHRFQNGLPIYRITDNITAAKTISTNKVWPTGGNGLALTGNGIMLGEWDGGGVRTTHRELSGKVFKSQGPLNYHSTHVAGTLIGKAVDANAKGMSYEGNLKAYDWNFDTIEMDTANVKVSNHSYGNVTGWRYGYINANDWYWLGDTSISQMEDYKFGYYDADARDFDQVAVNNPNYLICKSAGNDRFEGPPSIFFTTHWIWAGGGWAKVTAKRNQDGNADGYDCISSAGLAKNILTVGAVNDIATGYNGVSSVSLASFSSCGPADDGRIKPDVVANGVGLYSCLETSDSAYGSMSGTSMATPNAAGSVGLLLQHQQRLHGSTPLFSSTMKAIILNTTDEAGSAVGPDYMYGWGLMNTLKAAKLMTLDSIDGANSHIQELTLNQGNTIKFTIASKGIDSLRSSICWIDPASTPLAPSLNSRTKLLKNDLDIRIIRPRDNTVYYPWKLNPDSPSSSATQGDNIADNIEQTLINSTEKSLYQVQISHKGTLTGGPQKVSFVVSGNVNSIGPVYHPYSSSFGYSMIPDSVVTDSIKVKNLGDSLLILNISIPGSNETWMTLFSDSIAIASLDSAYIKFSIHPSTLTTWTAYSSAITIEHNDTTQATSNVSIALNTLGSTAHKSISKLEYGIDLGNTASDSFYLWNTGYIPLNFSIADTGKDLPNWLVMTSVTGSIPPGESLKISFTLNEIDLPRDNYYSTLVVSHNDNQTETYIIPVALYVGTSKVLSSSVTDFWNIVSLPVIPLDSRKTSLYPSSVSNAWSYDGSYHANDSLYPGTGYWLKFTAPETFNMTGYVFSIETLSVNAGWHLIGTLSSTILANTVTTDPPEILASNFFGFDHGYKFADTLYPGIGYWIKTNDAGKIILSGDLPPLSRPTAASRFEEYNSLTFSDELGNSQTLYFSIDKKPAGDINFYKLPPPAPEGSFDVRFASGSMLELFDSKTSSSQNIKIQVPTGKITVRASLKQRNASKLLITDESDNQFPLNGKNAIVLNGSKVISLSSQPAEVPTEYALAQNYPNPFNPNTVISFDLPVDNFVTLKVYNALGQEVATLVNGYKEAGKYSFDFDASNLPSGTYIYKMTADKFSAVKKMVLMR